MLLRAEDFGVLEGVEPWGSEKDREASRERGREALRRVLAHLDLSRALLPALVAAAGLSLVVCSPCFIGDTVVSVPLSTTSSTGNGAPAVPLAEPLELASSFASLTQRRRRSTALRAVREHGAEALMLSRFFFCAF